MPFTAHYGDADSSALGCCQGRAERAAGRAPAGGGRGSATVWQQPLRHGAGTCCRSGSGPGRDKLLKGLSDTGGWRPPEPAGWPAALDSSPGPGRGCSWASNQAGGDKKRLFMFCPAGSRTALRISHSTTPEHCTRLPTWNKCCTETLPRFALHPVKSC